MTAAGIPALIVSEIGNVQWLTGFTGSAGIVLLTEREAMFVTDSRYTLQAGEEVREMPVASFASPVLLADFLRDQIQMLGVRSIGFESSHVTYATFEDWAKRLAPIELMGVPDLIGPLRMIKSPQEIEAIRHACGLADACFTHIQRLVQPGISEFDIGLEIEFYFRRNGAEIAFAPVVVSGHRSARPHGRASEKKLDTGDFLTLDFGARIDGYNSDITRTLVVAEASERHREIYDTVLRAQLASLEAMKPGVPAREVDAVARQEMGDLAQYFGHGLGHGLGRLVHDGGRLNATSSDILAEGQVWTVEPGIYIEDFGGVRIEDDVVVTESGIEILTHSPKEMMVLP